jgi:hypothetical protein
VSLPHEQERSRPHRKSDFIRATTNLTGAARPRLFLVLRVSKPYEDISRSPRYISENCGGAGRSLRLGAFAEVEELSRKAGVEKVTVESRPATIAIIYLQLPSGGLKVVVQGFLKHRWFPGWSVARDGFYKYPDETIAPMAPEEFYEFDRDSNLKRASTFPANTTLCTPDNFWRSA